MRNTKRGFTLIELLVVIAIIAILAAILFPVFAKVREKARQTSCLSNEKQLGLAFAQYYEDYDEKWPAGVALKDTPATITTSSGLGNGWVGTLYAYIKSTGLLKCPDDSTTNNVQNTYTAYPVSYGFNSNAAAAADAQFTAPASTVALFEIQGATANVTATYANSAVGDGADASTSNTYTDSSYADNGNNLSADASVVWATSNLGGETGPNFGSFTNGNALHTGGSNFLLADGHAKWFRGSAVSAGYNNPNTGSNAPESGTAGAYYAAGTANTTTTTYAATFSFN
jgi:prepilin-type N-terminal cleavage/methylation domain-containing protein/prepilin-type processing-associated H-X9-DG protein